jgi:hypothetical protein
MPEQSQQPRLTEPPHPSEWLGKSGLMHFVSDALQTLDWPHKQEDFHLHGQSFPSRKLMALEVYCYARGVYASDEVEEIIHKDSTLREMFANDWPDPGMIRLFRRTHRATIETGLRRVFDQAFRVRFGEPESGQAPIDSCVAAALDRWFEPMCGPQPELEAEARMRKAVFWDGLDYQE